MRKTLHKVLVGALIALPLISFAQTTTPATSTPSTASSSDVTCIQGALEKRENALIAAHDVYNSAVKLALQTRLSNLKSSWAQTDRTQRIEKRLQAYKTFRTDVLAGNTVLRTSKTTIWKTYQTEAKVCGIKGTGESPTLIQNGNNSL